MHSQTLLSLTVLPFSLTISAYHLQARHDPFHALSLPTTISPIAPIKTSDVQNGTDPHFIQSVCYPTNSTGDLDPNAPCVQSVEVAETCVHGNSSTNNHPTEQSAADQQKCFCQGLYWQYLSGCMECERLHGAPLNSSWQPVQYLSAESSSYCGAATATLGLNQFLSRWTPTSTIAIGTSTGGVDVLGTSTEVSLYFNLVSTTATAASSQSTDTTGVAASSATQDAATVSTTGSTTGSATAVSTTTNSAATGLRVSAMWAAGLLAAAFVL
ncbi:MAG: hypothetical protein FRX48_02541 [Lasallia pustulata]|uniref:Uncharacterized protein n=1 Tax=Lasallia pustulata TaxID=136370 RepID=A0A5M8PYQ8_9LECA|nr:MAG: hypothetical protein FRX48_02541 [Lasallia pustulata]